MEVIMPIKQSGGRNSSSDSSNWDQKSFSRVSACYGCITRTIIMQDKLSPNESQPPLCSVVVPVTCSAVLLCPSVSMSVPDLCSTYLGHTWPYPMGPYGSLCG